jgi:hypothetical protein
MSIVRCPSCDRALNLPERSEVTTAQCPMCQHVFAVGRPASVPYVPPVPTPTVRPREDASPAPLPSFPGQSEDPQALALRRAVDSTSAWLRGAGIVGLLHLFFCSCVSFAFIGHDDLFILGYCGSYVFQLAASLIAYNGSTVLQRRSSRGWVQAAGVLSLLVGGLTAVLAVPVFSQVLRDLNVNRQQNTQESGIILLGALAANAVVVVFFLVAGVKTLLVLRRPEIRSGFRS